MKIVQNVLWGKKKLKVVILRKHLAMQMLAANASLLQTLHIITAVLPWGFQLVTKQRVRLEAPWVMNMISKWEIWTSDKFFQFGYNIVWLEYVCTLCARYRLCEWEKNTVQSQIQCNRSLRVLTDIIRSQLGIEKCLFVDPFHYSNAWVQIEDVGFDPGNRKPFKFNTVIQE